MCLGLYYDGDYDVRTVEGGARAGSARSPIATSPRFEARPSACYDAKGRLWIAYEEGPRKLGQGLRRPRQDGGNPLYNARSVRVVCLEDGKLMEPVAELPRLADESAQAGVGQAESITKRRRAGAYPRSASTARAGSG